jgi:hypothetical protein
MREKSAKWQGIVLGILLFGVLIGFSEAIFGHFFTLAKFPYKGGLLTGISFGLIGGIAFGIFRKPFIIMGAGIVGALMRMLLIPILKVSYTCFINGSLGIALEGIAIGSVAYVWMRTSERKNIYLQVATGALGAFIGSILFWATGMYVSPGKYLLTFMGNPIKWMMTESIIWALFTAVLLPAGYLAGSKILDRIVSFTRVKTWPVYVIGVVIIISCFVATAALYSVIL